MTILASNRESSYASSSEGIVRPELFHIYARREKILRNHLVQPLCWGRSARLVSSITSLPCTVSD